VLGPFGDKIEADVSTIVLCINMLKGLACPSVPAPFKVSMAMANMIVPYKLKLGPLDKSLSFSSFFDHPSFDRVSIGFN